MTARSSKRTRKSRVPSIPTWLAWSLPTLIIAAGLWFASPELHGVAAFIAGAVGLILGGNWLVESSVALSRMIGLSPLVIGLTVVAFGTSAPELALNISAAVDDNTPLSFGNVVGSNIANITLVLGCAGLISTVAVSRRIVRRELPWLLAASTLFCILAMSGAPVVEATPESPSTLPGWSRAAGIGLMTFFLISIYSWYRAEKVSVEKSLQQEIEGVIEEDALDTDSPWIALAVLLLSLAFLGGGGKGAEWGAVTMADQLGVSQVIVGLTVVAIATSLPEVMTTVIASLKNENDLALGNVVGSNMFNILLVMGVTSTVRPVPVPEDGWMDLAVMMVVSVGLFIVALMPGRRLTRVHGICFLVAFGSYIAFTIIRAGAGG